ncbi:MAG TPA: hypothetical protein VHW96_10205 [Solirubrobacteraceae bacterium]|jgi:hypothetical protein|nr:hypothetical protein [Solirubrobacteraceae bacterium]
MAAPKLEQARSPRRQRDPEIANLNVPPIELIARILERGYASETFVRRVDAVDLRKMISALPDLRDRYRRMLADMVVSYLVSA